MRIHRLAIALSIAAAVGGGALVAAQAVASATTREHPRAVQQRLAVQRGQKVYAQYCATCHGAQGKGDGLSGQALPIRPQDLTDGRVLNALPDRFLHAVIADGGQAVGLSPIMPAFRPQLSDAQIGDVVAFIRSIAQPAFEPAQVLPVPARRGGPKQPIFFSHLIHAGSFKLDCRYCHAGARRSSAASLPSVERCMGCHKVIAAQGNPEVQKLHQYWNDRKPIPWVRIFKLPEFVHFPHKNHVQAGLPCQTCHGRIEAMEQVEARTGQSLVNDLLNLAGLSVPPPPLTMGWCVECHRAANTGSLASLSWIGQPVPALKKKDLKAPLDCVTCHH
jgi:mono/diheme cytochrome c family protein